MKKVVNRVIGLCANVSNFKSSHCGFTLIEIMVAMTISMMIIGSVYAAFRSSLKNYQNYEVKIIMLQRCKSALDRMTQDIKNLFYVEKDQEMTFLVQDYADSETTMDMDMISFVSIVKPNLDNYVPLEEQEQTNSADEEESTNGLPSDLARIVYFVGPNPENQEEKCLMRIETTELDTEKLQEMMTELQSSSLSEELQNELKSAVLIDYITGLNVRYFDGTEWVDTWDMAETNALPVALEIALSVSDIDNKGKNLTQAIQIYLPSGKPASESSGSEETGTASPGAMPAGSGPGM